MLLSSGSRAVLTTRHLRGLAADLVLLVLAAAAGWSILVLGGRSGAVEPLAGAAVLTAVLLLALVGTLGADRRAQLIAGALGLGHVEVDLADGPAVGKALAPEPGLRLVEVRADRTALRTGHARLRAAVRTAAEG